MIFRSLWNKQVVLVQACQSTPRTENQAVIKMIDHQRIQHVELQRPNTALLLASKRGGLALRGAFTGAVADAVQVADGITDISAMFDIAAGGIMENQRCIEIGQIPEFRSTMSKLLILPPSSGAVIKHLNNYILGMCYYIPTYGFHNDMLQDQFGTMSQQTSSLVESVKDPFYI